MRRTRNASRRRQRRLRIEHFEARRLLTTVNELPPVGESTNNETTVEQSQFPAERQIPGDVGATISPLVATTQSGPTTPQQIAESLPTPTLFVGNGVIDATNSFVPGEGGVLALNQNDLRSGYSVGGNVYFFDTNSGRVLTDDGRVAFDALTIAVPNDRPVQDDSFVPERDVLHGGSFEFTLDRTALTDRPGTPQRQGSDSSDGDRIRVIGESGLVDLAVGEVQARLGDSMTSPFHSVAIATLTSGVPDGVSLQTVTNSQFDFYTSPADEPLADIPITDVSDHDSNHGRQTPNHQVNPHHRAADPTAFSISDSFPAVGHRSRVQPKRPTIGHVKTPLPAGPAESGRQLSEVATIEAPNVRKRPEQAEPSQAPDTTRVAFTGLPTSDSANDAPSLEIQRGEGGFLTLRRSSHSPAHESAALLAGYESEAETVMEPASQDQLVSAGTPDDPKLSFAFHKKFDDVRLIPLTSVDSSLAFEYRVGRSELGDRRSIDWALPHDVEKQLDTRRPSSDADASAHDRPTDEFHSADSGSDSMIRSLSDRMAGPSVLIVAGLMLTRNTDARRAARSEHARGGKTRRFRNQKIEPIDR